MDHYDYCAAALRRHDRDRYVADLFAAPRLRKHLFALHAFGAEIARVRDVVSEPGLGEIRLQWWRDALAAGGAGHPVAAALVDTISQYAMPRAAFEMLIDARTFDLYDDPMPSLSDLEGYAGETASLLIHLSATVLAGGRNLDSAEAAGHAGVALTLAGITRALPRHAARGQCYLPDDLMAAHGVERAALFARTKTPQLLSLLAELRSIARGHVAAAERAAADLDPVVRPGFLPLALVGPDLDLMDGPSYDPFSPRPVLAPWRRLWIMWLAARR